MITDSQSAGGAQQMPAAYMQFAVLEPQRQPLGTLYALAVVANAQGQQSPGLGGRRRQGELVEGNLWRDVKKLKT